MFDPRYDLNQKILESLSKVERFYGKLETLKIPRPLELNLRRDNFIMSVHASNSIEGNPLSLPEVSNLLLGDRVPVNRDEKEVENYFRLLGKLDELVDKRLDLGVVKDLHKELLSGVDDSIAGKVRDKRVVVGGYRRGESGLKLKVKHDPPFHSKQEIERAVKELFNWIEKSGEQALIKAGLFHHRFVYLHPFVDGNGRVCRLLTALVFLKSGYKINKYFVLDDYYDIDRTLYSDKLHSADRGKTTEWLEYFVDGVKYSMQSALVKVEDLVGKLDMEIRPTAREGEVLEFVEKNRQITSTELAEYLRVSRQQAYKLLDSLMEKGLVDKKGKTKGSYYFLK